MLNRSNKLTAIGIIAALLAVIALVAGLAVFTTGGQSMVQYAEAEGYNIYYSAEFHLSASECTVTGAASMELTAENPVTITKTATATWEELTMTATLDNTDVTDSFSFTKSGDTYTMYDAAKKAEWANKTIYIHVYKKLKITYDITGLGLKYVSASNAAMTDGGFTRVDDYRITHLYTYGSTLAQSPVIDNLTTGTLNSYLKDTTVNWYNLPTSTITADMTVRATAELIDLSGVTAECTAPVMFKSVLFDATYTNIDTIKSGIDNGAITYSAEWQRSDILEDSYSKEDDADFYRSLNKAYGVAFMSATGRYKLVTTLTPNNGDTGLYIQGSAQTFESNVVLHYYVNLSDVEATYDGEDHTFVVEGKDTLPSAYEIKFQSKNSWDSEAIYTYDQMADKHIEYRTESSGAYNYTWWVERKSDGYNMWYDYMTSPATCRIEIKRRELTISAPTGSTYITKIYDEGTTLDTSLQGTTDDYEGKAYIVDGIVSGDTVVVQLTYAQSTAATGIDITPSLTDGSGAYYAEDNKNYTVSADNCAKGEIKAYETEFVWYYSNGGAKITDFANITYDYDGTAKAPYATYIDLYGEEQEVPANCYISYRKQYDKSNKDPRYSALGYDMVDFTWHEFVGEAIIPCYVDYTFATDSSAVIHYFGYRMAINSDALAATTGYGIKDDAKTTAMYTINRASAAFVWADSDNGIIAYNYTGSDHTVKAKIVAVINGSIKEHSITAVSDGNTDSNTYYASCGCTILQDYLTLYDITFPDPIAQIVDGKAQSILSISNATPQTENDTYLSREDSGDMFGNTNVISRVYFKYLGTKITTQYKVLPLTRTLTWRFANGTYKSSPTAYLDAAMVTSESYTTGATLSSTDYAGSQTKRPYPLFENVIKETEDGDAEGYYSEYYELSSTGGWDSIGTLNKGNPSLDAGIYKVVAKDHQNYVFTNPIVYFEVKKVKLEFDSTCSVTKTYNGTTTVSSNESIEFIDKGSFDGNGKCVSMFLNGGDVNMEFNSATVAAAYKVSFKNATINNSDVAKNYYIDLDTVGSASASITAATIKINCLAKQTFSFTGLEPTLANVEGTNWEKIDGTIYKLDGTNYDDIGVTLAGKDSPVDIGTYDVEFSCTNSNYTLVADDASTFTSKLEITIAKLTIKLAEGKDAVSKTYDGDTTCADTQGYEVVGYAVGHNDVTVTVVYKDANSTYSNNYVYISAIEGNDASYYSTDTIGDIEDYRVAASISKKELTLSLPSDASIFSKEYDGTTALDASKYTLSGIVGTETVTATVVYNDKSVNDAESVSISALDGADKANYTFKSETTYDAEITKAKIYLSTSTVSKVYDGTTDVESADYTVQGVASGETVEVTVAYNDATVVGASSISITAIGDEDNYEIEDDTTNNQYTASITAKDITIKSSGFSVTKAYDGDTTVAEGEATYSLDGVVSGDTVTVGFAFGSSDAASSISLTCTLGGTDAGNYNLTGSYNGSITKAQIYLSTSTVSKTYDGTTDVETADYTVNGIISGESVDVTVAYNDKDVADATYIYIKEISDTTNYAIETTTTSNKYTASISKKELTLSKPEGVTSFTKVYDGKTDFASSNYVLTGIVEGETVTATVVFDNKDATGTNAATSISITALSGADNANYTFTAATTYAASITKAKIYLSTSTVSKTYDGTTDVETADYTVKGVISGESVDVTVAYNDEDVSDASYISITAIDNTTNYEIDDSTNASSNQYTASITAKNISIKSTGFSVTKAYDGDTTVAEGEATYSLDGVVSGDTVTVGFTFASEDVATSISLTCTLGGTDAGNYNLTGSYTGSITKAQIYLSTSTVSKAYDGTTDVETADYTVQGIISGESVDVTVAYNDKDVADATYIYIKSISDTSNYAIETTTTSNKYTASISKKELTLSKPEGVTSFTKVYDGKTDFASSNYVLTGIVEGETVTATVVFDNKDATGTNAATSISITALSGADNANYTFTAATTYAASITKAKIYLSTSTVSKTYDGTTDVETADYTVKGVISGESVDVTVAYNDEDVSDASYISITAIDNTTNYEIDDSTDASSNQYTASITAKDISIKSTGFSVTKAYDGDTTVAEGEATYELNDVVSGDTVTVGFTFASEDVATSIGLTCTLGGTDADNYNLTGSYTGSITAKDITIETGYSVTKTYDGDTTVAEGEATYSLDGVESGDTVTVTFTFASEDVASSISLTCTLGGTDAGNYNLTSSYTGSITKKDITIEDGYTVTKTYDGDTTVAEGEATYSLDGVVSGDTVTVGFTFGSANVGDSISLTCALDGTDKGNYNLTGSYTGSITAKDISIKSSGFSVTKTYDGDTTVASGEATYELDGVVGSDNVTVEFTFGSSDAADSISLTCTLGGTQSGNYNLTGSYTGSITKKEVTLTWSDVVEGEIEYKYDAANHGPTATFTGVGTEGELSATIAYEGSGETSYASSETAPIEKGSYTASASHTNYSFTNATHSFTIVASEPVTITWDTNTFVYSGSAQNPTATFKDGNDTDVEVPVKKIYVATDLNKADISATGSINVGTYVVEVDIYADAVKKFTFATDAETSKTYSITAKEIDIALVFEDVTFNGKTVTTVTPQEATYVDTGKFTIKTIGTTLVVVAEEGYSVDSVSNLINTTVSYALTTSTADAGSHAVTATLSGTGASNYSLKNAYTARLINSGSAELISAVYNIKPAEVTLTWAGDTGLVYNTAAQIPTASFSGFDTDGSATTINLDTSEITLKDSKAGILGGDYTAVANVSAYTNYKFADADLSDEYSISAAELTLAYAEGASSFSKVYDGSVDVDFASATALTINGLYAADASSITLTVEFNDATVAGANEIEVKSSDFGSLSTSYTWGTKKIGTGISITPKELTVTWANTSLTYDGNEQLPTASITGTVGEDDCDVEASGNQTAANVVSNPTYTATATLTGADNGNYTIGTGETQSFTIAAKEVKLEADGGVIGKNYDGTKAIGSAGNFKVTGILEADTSVGYIVEFASADVGTTTISIIALTGAGNTNYCISTTDNSLEATIGSMTAFVVWDENDFTYTGSDQTVTAHFTNEEGNSVALNVEITEGDSKFNKPGNYTMKASFANEETAYTLSGETKSYTMKKIALSLEYTDAEYVFSKTYDGDTTVDEETFIANLTIGGYDAALGATLTYTFTYNSKNVDAASYLTLTNVEEESETLDYDIYDTDALKAAAPQFNAIITAKEIGVVWADYTAFVYNSKNQAPTATAVEDDLISGDTTKIGIEGAKTAASDSAYTALAVSSNTNYVVKAADQNKDFTISKAKVSIALAPGADKVSKKYDGTTDIAGATGYVIKGIYNNEITATVVFDDADVADVTKVSITELSSTDNYEIDTDYDELTDVEITKIEASFVIDTPYTKTYGDESMTAGAGHVPEILTCDADKYAISVVFASEDAGDEVELTVSIVAPTSGDDASGNYDLKGTYKGSISKKTVAITWCEDNFTYNGAEQTVTATYKDINSADIALAISFSDSKTFKKADSYTAVAAFAEADTGSKNYELPSTVTNSYTINPNKVTIAMTGASITKTYDGTTDVDSSAYTVSGIFNDEVTATVAFDSADVTAATKVVLTISTNSDYVLGDVTELTASITAKEIVIDWCANSFTYNGAEQTVTASYKDVDETAQSLTVAIGDSKTFKDAGDYTATVSFANGETNYALPATASADYNIAQAAITLAYAEGCTKVIKVYDGTTASTGATGYIVKGIFNEEVTPVLVFDSADVTAVSSFGFDSSNNFSNYTLGDALTSVEITPKEVVITWCANSFTYTSEAQTITATYADVDSADISLAISIVGGKTFKDAGKYTATASFANSETNYKLPAVTYSDFDIAKSKVTIAKAESVESITKVFDGTKDVDAANYTVSGTFGTEVTVTVEFDSANVTEATKIVLSISENNNYELGDVTELAATITAKEITIDWCEDNFTYNAEDQAVTASYKDVESTDIDLSIAFNGGLTFHHVGQYTAVASFANSETNYKLPATVTKVYTIYASKVTIAKADGVDSITKTFDNTKTVDSANYVVSGIFGTEVTATVEYDSENVADATKIVLSISANYNYQLGDVKELAASITAKEIAITWSEDSYTYNSTVQTVTASYEDITAATVALTVSFEGSKTFKDADTYTAIASFATTTTNYALPAEYTKEYSIAKAKVSIASASGNKVVKTYDGTTDVLASEYTVTGIINEEVTATVVFNSSEVTDASKLVLSISGNSNYELGTYEIEAGIEAKEIVIDWCANDFTYTAEVQEVTASYNDVDGSPVDLTVTIADSKTFRNAGTYTAVASFANSETNYKLPAVAYSTYEIKVALVGIAFAAEGQTEVSKVFDGNIKTENLVKGYVVTGIFNEEITTVVEFDDENKKDVTKVILKTLVASGTTDYTANYKIDTDKNTLAAVITATPITIDWCTNDFTYTGAEQTVTASYKDIVGNVVTLGVSIDDTFKNAKTGYTATVSFINDETDYALPEVYTKSYDIKKAKVSIAFASEGQTKVSKVYDSNTDVTTVNPGFEVKGIFNDGEITATVKYDTANVATATKVYISALSDDSNYEIDSAACELAAEITPKTVSITWCDNDYTYTSEEQDITATYTDIDNATVDLDITINDTFKNADEYTATASFANGETNYALPEVVTKVYNIKKAKVSIAFAEQGKGISKVFDGSNDTTAASSCFTVNGIFNKEITATVLFNSANVAEATKVYISALSNDANYVIDADACELTASISAKEVEYTWTDDVDDTFEYIYNGQKQAPKAYYTDINGTKVDASISGAKTTIGTYVATASDDDTNYTVSNTTKEFVILARAAEVVWGENEFIYNGKNQVPAETFINVVTDINYKVVGAAKVVGSYTAEMVCSDPNYTFTNTSCDFTIANCELSVNWKDLSLIYNGKVQRPKAFVNTIEGEAELTVGVYGESIEAGKYSAVVAADELPNYTIVGNLTVEYEILESEISCDNDAAVEIILSNPAGFEPGLELEVKVIGDDEDAYAECAASLPGASDIVKQYKLAAMYSIKLTKNGEVVAVPAGTVITIAYPDYYINTTGEVKAYINGTKETEIFADDGMQTFTLNLEENGTIAIVTELSSIEKVYAVDTWVWLVVAMAIAGAGVAIALAIVLTKKKKAAIADYNNSNSYVQYSYSDSTPSDFDTTEESASEGDDNSSYNFYDEE